MSKKVWGQIHEQLMHQELDEFFTSKRVTFDVRVRCDIDVNVAQNASKAALKKEIRSRMMKEFRKELSKQIKDQI